MTSNFLNKNWYRKYPFRASASLLSVGGQQMDNALIVGCSLSLSIPGSAVDLFISRVKVSNRHVHVEVSWGASVVASGHGVITLDNQVVALTNKNGVVIGHCVVGSQEVAAGLDTCYQFTLSTAALEGSCVKYRPVPGVRALTHNGKRLTGRITLELTNLKLTQVNGKLLINVGSLQQINSRGDKTAEWLTCDNAMITGINEVRPEPGSGLIELFGVAPVTVTVTANGIQVGLEEGVTLETLCKEANTPAPSNSNDYKGYLASDNPDRNVLVTNDPEWKDWPQYSDE